MVLRDVHWATRSMRGRLSDMSGERCAGDGRGGVVRSKGASASHQDAEDHKVATVLLCGPTKGKDLLRNCR